MRKEFSEIRFRQGEPQDLPFEDGIPVGVAESTLAPRLASLGLTKINGTAEPVIYNGGSLWADYWTETITKLRGDSISPGKLDQALIDRFLACCCDSNWWTQTIAFTAVHGRMLVAKPQHLL